MAVYLDSSAIVKLVVRARESSALRRFLRTRRKRVSCALARIEVLRAGATWDPRPPIVLDAFCVASTSSARRHLSRRGRHARSSHPVLARRSSSHCGATDRTGAGCHCDVRSALGRRCVAARLPRRGSQGQVARIKRLRGIRRPQFRLCVADFRISYDAPFGSTCRPFRHRRSATGASARRRGGLGSRPRRSRRLSPERGGNTDRASGFGKER